VCQNGSPADKDYTVHRMILGTHTSGSERNFLHIASVRLPKPGSTNADKQQDKYDASRGEIGEYNDTQPRIKIQQSIVHDGEVNRARYMPQNCDLIATKTASGQVHVFDRTKHPTQPKADDDKPKPDITLNGHTKEGYVGYSRFPQLTCKLTNICRYGLAWNATTAGEGHLLSASEDTTVCHWDIKAYSKSNSVLEPLRIYRGHSSVVEDVAWHPEADNVFASVADDMMLML